MQITIIGRHFEVTEPLREYVTERLERLANHLPNILSMNVTLTVEKLQQIAEVRVHVPGSELLATGDSADMYSAIDELYEKLKRVLDKHKGKSERHQE
jgi:putative sigma-54 modulation protein